MTIAPTPSVRPEPARADVTGDLLTIYYIIIAAEDAKADAEVAPRGLISPPKQMCVLRRVGMSLAENGLSSSVGSLTHTATPGMLR